MIQGRELERSHLMYCDISTLADKAWGALNKERFPVRYPHYCEACYKLLGIIVVFIMTAVACCVFIQQDKYASEYGDLGCLVVQDHGTGEPDGAV